jgi:hypothetical protein
MDGSMGMGYRSRGSEEGAQSHVRGGGSAWLFVEEDGMVPFSPLHSSSLSLSLSCCIRAATCDQRPQFRLPSSCQPMPGRLVLRGATGPPSPDSHLDRLC